MFMGPAYNFPLSFKNKIKVEGLQISILASKESNNLRENANHKIKDP